VVHALGRDAGQVHPLEPAQHPELAARIAEAVEDHREHPGLEVELPVGGAEDPAQLLIEPELAPDLGEQPRRPDTARRIEVHALLIGFRHTGVAAQAANEAADGLLGALVGAPELGNLAVAGLALGVAVALDEPQVGMTVGARGADEHGSAA